MLVLTLAALGRHVPPPSIAPDGVVLGSCSWFSRSPGLADLLAHYRAAQHLPELECGAASRFLLLDDLNEQTGLGFGFLALHAIFLHALSENRTLLPSSAVLHGQTWRWCGEGARDYSCYFEPWSSGSCVRAVGAWAYGSGNASIVPWHAPSLGQASLHARVVRLRLTDEPTQEVVFRLYRAWMHCTPAIGRSWWWGATWDILLRFAPWVERQALAFIADHGVRLTEGADAAARISQSDGTLEASPLPLSAAEPFVVVIVRHGGKHVEERLVGVQEYLRPLERLLSPQCLNGRHVLLVTETASVVRNFSAACSQRGWNCFWTDQQRLDLDIDPWNPGDPRNSYGSSQRVALYGEHAGEASHGEAAGGVGSIATPAAARRGGGGRRGGRGAGGPAFASSTAMLHHIGWHSVLNLAIAQHGAGLIGSFGSSWSQLTLSFMHRRHRAPVLGCSLRPGWKGDNMYSRVSSRRAA